MKYKFVSLILGLLIVSGCMTSSKMVTPRSSPLNVFSPILTPLSSSDEAGAGPIMFVGALTILLGVIAAFGFRKIRTGIGMMLTGGGIGWFALVVQDFAGVLLLLLILIGGGYGVWLLTDSTFRRRLKKHAKSLYAQNRNHEAAALEAEAEDRLP